MAKTAVITGSGRGLGLAMAKVFRAKGFNVVVSDFNEANLANAVKELNGMNGLFSGVTGVLADVTSLSDLEYLWTKQFRHTVQWISGSIMQASISRWYRCGN